MNFESLESSLLNLQHNYDKGGISDEIIEEAQNLQAKLAEFLRKSNENPCSDSFYKPLIQLLETEGKKLEQNATPVNLQNLAFIKAILGCLRSSFFKHPSGQQMVVETDEFLLPLVQLLKVVIQDLLPDKIIQGLPDSDARNSGQALKDSIAGLASMCITSFVNMMAGNPNMRSALWNHLQPLLLSAVSYPSPEVGHAGSALLHQFLLDDTHKKQLCRDGHQYIPALLISYQTEGPHACFSLFCLELLMESPEPLTSCWANLGPSEALLALDVLTALVQKGANHLPLDSVQFMLKLFQKDADKIFRLRQDTLRSLEPAVVARMANFLSCAAACDRFRHALQEELSLLVSTVYLLRGITMAGNEFVNEFSRLRDGDGVETEDRVSRCPTFGLKSDLIRLIAALVYRHRSNQDLVREADGLLLILENSRFDARNPLIREAAVLALRNLLEGNSENQRVLSELELRGMAPNETLAELGLVARLEDGQVTLRQA